MRPCEQPRSPNAQASEVHLVIRVIIALLLVTGSAAVPTGAQADHIGGTFTVCGRVTAYSAPLPGSPGSLTVAGVVDGADHAFPIAETATVDPRLTPLSAGGEWTCLDLVADGAAVVTSIAVPADAARCGPLSESGGTIIQGPGSTQDFTTLTLDGDAAAIVMADPDLAALVPAIASVDPIGGSQEACFDIGLAVDGTIGSLALDYPSPSSYDLPAPIACGAVAGTPIAYRDPASQPYPDGPTVEVDGFVMDADILDDPYEAVLAFHLDAGRDICLLARVVDSAIVDTAAITFDADVCGELEVVGGLVFVDTVVVSEVLTAISFADPSAASLGSACWSARAQAGVASGRLDVCGDLQSVTPTAYAVSGITFHLSSPLDLTTAPPLGGPQTISLDGQSTFDPAGPPNPARFEIGTLDGCPTTGSLPPPDDPGTGGLPDTRTSPDRPPSPIALWLMGTLAIAGGAALVAFRVPRRQVD